jgi:hypothetical protein
MLADGERPRVEQSANGLGVSESFDIDVEDGEVSPNDGGMSVSSSVETLYPSRVPAAYAGQVPGARRRTPDLAVWAMGEGAFESGPVGPGLVLRPDPSDVQHGFVAPSEAMALADYRKHLAATAGSWRVVPPEGT